MSTKPTKYIAVKVKGLDHFIWFERAKTKEEAAQFCGTEGWGEGGAFTNLTCESPLIEARIDSESLQYT